jgi:hypothetical protein
MENSMINIKTAVKDAREYFIDLFGEDVGSPQLEEAELSDDAQYWNVTLSYKSAKETLSQSYTSARIYKVFKLRADTGEVLSMKDKKTV